VGHGYSDGCAVAVEYRRALTLRGMVIVMVVL
jgi:hypothetical protein